MVFQNLLQPKGPRLHVLVAPEDFDLLGTFDPAVHKGVAIRRIRGRKAPTTAALFDEVAAALQFPSYFGENWDAFDECLNDLEWLPGDAYVLLIEDAVHLLKQERAEEFRVFLTALDRAGKAWGKPGEGSPARKAKAFVVVLQCAKADEAALRKRLEECQVSFTTMEAPKS